MSYVCRCGKESEYERCSIECVVADRKDALHKLEGTIDWLIKLEDIEDKLKELEHSD